MSKEVLNYDQEQVTVRLVFSDKEGDYEDVDFTLKEYANLQNEAFKNNMNFEEYFLNILKQGFSDENRN